MTSAVYDVIGRHLDTTLEQFEIGFMRDMYPERELAVWVRITKGWIAYHEEFIGDEPLPNGDEKKLLAALVAISTGIQDASKLGVSEEVGRGRESDSLSHASAGRSIQSSEGSAVRPGQSWRTGLTQMADAKQPLVSFRQCMLRAG